jgi:hypothetical protein
MPYFYNTTLRTTWKIPHDPSYLERTHSPASDEQKQRLVTLLTNRRKAIEREASERRAVAADSDSKKMSAGVKETEPATSRTLEKFPKSSHPNVPDRPTQLEDMDGLIKVARPSFQDHSKHPLHIARTKLNSDIISDDEYSQIVRTHKMMEKEQRTVVLEGELKKKGQRLGIFVKRWFVLHSDHMLSSCRSSHYSDSPTTVIDLSKCTCMPLDGVSGQPHCIEITEMHGDTQTILAAPTVEAQVSWLEAMLTTKSKTMGMGRLNVIKCAAALKNVKRRAKMPSM